MERTNQLYDLDPFLKECQAIVVEERLREDGTTEVILNQTIFYPTGGGQPHDTGWIQDIKVLDVYKKAGVITHVLENTLNGETEVTTRIDWDRRFDHMQQHAGQHLLSRVFEVLYEGETIGFHLGEETVTIDVTLESLSEEMVQRIERLANQMIRENREIERKFIAADSIPEQVKSKIPELEEHVRIVEIADFDNCACSGTHPHSTLEIGWIKILGWEKYKKQIRVSFVCGNRAFNILSKFQKEVNGAASLLKTNWADVKNSIIRLMDEKGQLEKKLKDLQGKILQYEIEEWKKKARFKDKFYYVEGIFENRDMSEMRLMAQGVTQASSYVVVFTNVMDDKIHFLLQRSEDLDISMNDCVKVGLEVVDGKGGGNPRVAQGGGTNKDNMNDAIEAMRAYILGQK